MDGCGPKDNDEKAVGIDSSRCRYKPMTYDAQADAEMRVAVVTMLTTNGICQDYQDRYTGMVIIL